MRGTDPKGPSAQGPETAVPSDIDTLLDKLYFHYTRHGGYAMDCLAECRGVFSQYSKLKGEPR